MTTPQEGVDLRERRRILIDRLSARRERLHTPATPAEQKAQSQPLRSIAGAAAQTWWQSHPLHAGLDQVEARTRDAVQPMATNRPYQLLALATLAGAVGAALIPARLRVIAIPYLAAQATGLVRHVGLNLLRWPR